MWSSFYSEKCQQCNTQIQTMQADAYNRKITWHAMDSSQAASFEYNLDFSSEVGD